MLNQQSGGGSPPLHNLLDTIDRLLARALALTFYGLDCSPEIELAQQLAIAAETRAAA